MVTPICSRGGRSDTTGGLRGISNGTLWLMVVGIAALMPGLLAPSPAAAHEAWVLTPAEMIELLSLPTPAIFHQPTIANVAISVLALLAIGAAMVAEPVWQVISRQPAEKVAERFGAFIPLAMRLSMAALFVLAALGLMPRHGTEILTMPTLMFPDLELGDLGPGWSWLAPAQLALAVCLVSGLFVRAAAAATIGLAVLAHALFGNVMFTYSPHVVAPALFLLFRGAGRFALSIPPLPVFERSARALEDWPAERVQLLLQILIGAGFVYMGVAWKLLQPTLIMHIVEAGGVPRFGLPLDIFAFAMAMVEIVVGLLVMFGVLVQPMCLVLFGAFAFMSITLGENPLIHIHIYGVMIALLVHGAGRWQLSRAPTAAWAEALVPLLLPRRLVRTLSFGGH